MDRCNRVVAQILAALAGPGPRERAPPISIAWRADVSDAASAGVKGYRGYPCVLCTSVNEEVVAPAS